MNGDTNQQPGPIPSILDSVYARPLEELKLPFSNTNLKKIHTISNLHSNFFQNIIFYTHDNFEISVLGDSFNAEKEWGQVIYFLHILKKNQKDKEEIPVYERGKVILKVVPPVLSISNDPLSWLINMVNNVNPKDLVFPTSRSAGSPTPLSPIRS